MVGTLPGHRFPTIALDSYTISDDLPLDKERTSTQSTLVFLLFLLPCWLFRLGLLHWFLDLSVLGGPGSASPALLLSLSHPSQGLSVPSVMQVSLSVQPSLHPDVRQAPGTSRDGHHDPYLFPDPRPLSPSMGSSPTHTPSRTQESPWLVPPSPRQHHSGDLSLLSQAASFSTHSCFPSIQTPPLPPLGWP